MSAKTQIETEIRLAYAFLRERNNTIPSETLQFMLDASLEKLQGQNLPIADGVGRSEQLMCYEYDLNGKSKPCKEQCKKCHEYQLRADSA
jgi:hypothetical protein